ncbi:MAG TPA: transketolase C-terminal domain-containing protein, partial [Solirubrobacterales bacterium]
EDATFLVPDGVRERFAATVGQRGRKGRADWQATLDRYEGAGPVRQLLAGELPQGWDKDVPAFPADAKGIATREASGKALNAIARRVPWLMGGSADLAPSTKTLLEFEDAGGDFEAGRYGARNLRFGVREHAMGAIASGLALARLRPYAATFLIFSDYMRPSMRLAALMGQPVTYVFTHDSIGLGQDGPTHQPIEQLAALRAIPNLSTIRPCDANETAEAWRIALARTTGPTALVLSRQPLPTLDRTRYAPAAGLARGGYVLADTEGGAPELILIATGSEVAPCVQAFETLKEEGVRVRLVSLPSFDLFEAQDEAYRREVLPPDVAARVAVEAASPLGWDRYAGPAGEVIAMRSFGASARIKPLMEHFGFTVDAVLGAAYRQLGKEAQ